MEEKEEFSFFPPSNGSCIGQLTFPAMDKNKKQKLKDKDKRTKKKQTNEKTRTTKILHRTVSYKRTNQVPFVYFSW